MSRTIFALLVLALFAAIAHASPVRRQDSGNCEPVIFNSTIPAQLCASPDGSTVDSAETDLSWQGGNGRYNFFRTMSDDDTRFYYLHNTSFNHITVSMSVIDHYPSGTKFNFGIESTDDLSGECGGDFTASSTTGDIPVQQC